MLQRRAITRMETQSNIDVIKCLFWSEMKLSHVNQDSGFLMLQTADVSS